MCWKQWLLWNSVGYWIGFLLLHKKSLATNSATSSNSRTVSQFLWPGVWPWLSCVVCFGSHGAAGCWLCCVLSRGLTGVSLVSGLGLSHGFLEAAPSTGQPQQGALHSCGVCLPLALSSKGVHLRKQGPQGEPPLTYLALSWCGTSLMPETFLSFAAEETEPSPGWWRLHSQATPACGACSMCAVGEEWVAGKLLVRWENCEGRSSPESLGEAALRLLSALHAACALLQTLIQEAVDGSWGWYVLDADRELVRGPGLPLKTGPQTCLFQGLKQCVWWEGFVVPAGFGMGAFSGWPLYTSPPSCMPWEAFSDSQILTGESNFVFSLTIMRDLGVFIYFCSPL